MEIKSYFCYQSKFPHVILHDVFNMPEHVNLVVNRNNKRFNNELNATSTHV